MSDAADLRAILNQTDTSAPAIQSSSRGMMRFYDKAGGATMAVSEWRSVLQTSSLSQSLPLLYVANEVLQTSKRNRGNRFLEAFSPVLGSCLQFICGRDGSVVEKVRRVVKIWGDRRVFSMRYVMDVLGGLDSFRGGAMGMAAATPKAATTPPKPTSPSASTVGSSVTTNSDDEDDLFGGSSDGPKLLDINIDATALSAAQSKPTPPEFGAGAKRRRSSTANSPVPLSGSTGPISKKNKALSGQNFLDLFQSIVNLDEKYKSSIGVIESIPTSYLDEGSTDIDDLVGDELTDMYKKVCQTQRNVRREHRTMYSVAVQRRDLEKEAKRYVSWLKNLAKVDDDDIEFCDKLEKKLDAISVCHEEAKSARDKRRAEESQKRVDAEATAQREVEDEERRRILDDAKMEAEAKPGMMWNRELREYQYLHDPTEESWRD
mmetsp:Transcript_20690/g.39142  ORF Transcript_20690/g.39142 Transcript_20690/m.39142 type:complete len:433 (+) Transcript_20690:82-1380(+)